jgi:hypothetical protein
MTYAAPEIFSFFSKSSTSPKRAHLMFNNFFVTFVYSSVSTTQQGKSFAREQAGVFLKPVHASHILTSDFVAHSVCHSFGILPKIPRPSEFEL